MKIGDFAAMFDRVSTVSLDGPEISNVQREQLAGLPNLVRVAIYAPRITASEVDQLESLNNVTSLCLADIEATDTHDGGSI